MSVFETATIICILTLSFVSRILWNDVRELHRRIYELDDKCNAPNETKDKLLKS